MDCTHPRLVKIPKTTRRIYVPCGMCIACRIAKTREWTLRLMMEKKSWTDSGFLTLTYDNDNVPTTACGHLTLYPDHLSEFMNALRERLRRSDREQSYKGSVSEGKSPPLLRYYACGEYGDNTHRPHYHAVVYGIGSDDADLCLDVWKKGHVKIDPLTRERAQYCAQYVQKKIFKDPRKYWDMYGCVVQPFQRQSQGICLSYYESHKEEYWINLRPTINGVSYSTPRYLTKKDELLKAAISIRSKAANFRELMLQQKCMDEGYDIYASMQQREANLKAKSRMKKGKL